jgi:hypothetical protein
MPTIRPLHRVPPRTAVPSAGSRAPATPLAPAPVADPVPDVPGIIRSHRDPVARNEAFNRAYQALGSGIQEAVDPGFGFRGPSAGVLPNWFAVGAHASPQVGRSMVAAERTLKGLELLQGKPHLHDRAEIFDAMGLQGRDRQVAEQVAKALRLAGARGPEATAVASFATVLGAANRATATAGLTKDPRVAIATAWRMWHLVKPEGKGLLGTATDALRGLFGGNGGARDSQVVGRVIQMAQTYRSLLADGNRAIFADIGASGEAYLRLRASLGRPTPEAVLEKLALPESSEQGAKKVYAYALAHHLDAPPPTDFRRFSGPGAGNDVVRAGFALYELAGRTEDPARKNALVAFANNLIAWREQFEAVQPAFEGARAGELSRQQVISAITPVVQVDVGGMLWTLDGFARAAGDRDGKRHTAPASEYDWSRFDDRWPAILDAFRLTYTRPEAAFRFPDPRVR